MRNPLLLALASLIVLPAAWAAPVPAAAVFSPPVVSGAELSPDGRRVALRILGPQGFDQLAVVDLETQQRRILANENNADVSSFYWMGDKRLVFRFNQPRKRPLMEASMTFGWYAVDADGANRYDLSAPLPNSSQRPLPARAQVLIRDGAQDGKQFYALQAVTDRDGYITHANLLLADGATGRFKVYEHKLGQVREWIVDAGGEPRLALARAGDKDTLYHRDNAGNWRSVSEWPQAQMIQAVLPQFCTADATCYVSMVKGGDKRALFRLDGASAKIDAEPIVELSDYDFDGEQIYRDGRLAGLRYTSAARDTAWFDAQAKAVQAKVDALLKSTINEISIPRRGDSPFVLVRAYAGNQPDAWLAYNSKTGALQPLGASRPNVDSKSLAEPDLVNFSARDGLPLHAWLTLPKGSKGKGMPLVLLLNSNQREPFGFFADAQFLASRGAAVLQPQLRGGPGLGQRHFDAGLGQTGRAMVDDVVDSLRWAIKEGIADPKRICIVARYGRAYQAVRAAMQGEPGLACVAEIDGTLSHAGTFDRDLPQFLDTPGGLRQYSVSEVLGPRASVPLLGDLAPAQLQAPVLSLHGIEASPLVLAEVTRMQDAGKARGLPMGGQKLYEQETTLRDPVNVIDAWEQVAKFVGERLKL